MDDVTAPWNHLVDVADYGIPDFDTRNATIGIRGGKESTAHQIPALVESEHLNNSAVADRCLRLFIANYVDMHDDWASIRDIYDVKVTIPPRGWVNDSRYPLSLDETDYVAFEEDLMVATTETVRNMMGDLVNSSDSPFTSKSHFARRAVAWTGGFPTVSE